MITLLPSQNKYYEVWIYEGKKKKEKKGMK